ncbi:MAG: hypothetical protein IIB83_01200 [Bacteroidetes bacterium]|nr:hypothetical protein [Bacteroidota bacterium]MCH8325173.1 hypothetical protein [Bacteroidota bacterium]
MRKNIHIIILSLLFSIVLWVSITMLNDYYTTYNFPLKLVDFPKGYSSAVEIPKDISVKLKGQGWKLFTLNLGVLSVYKVSVGKGRGKKVLNLATFLGENQWLSSVVEVINVQPNTISINVERTRTKKLKVIPQIRLDFKQGYGLAAKLKISPDTIKVTGPRSTMRKLKSILTNEIMLNELDKSIQKEITLMDIQGVTYSPDKINITLDVQKIVEMNIDEIIVEVLNVPRNREVVLLPNKITCSVRGGIDVIGKLTNDQFKATVNYRDIIYDTSGSIQPKIILPENTTLLFTQPERVQYVIKRYK